MMFKKIILLDRDGEHIEEFIRRYPNIQIILVAEKKQKILELLKQKARNIITFIEYDNFLTIQNSKKINYKTIEKLKNIQNDIEVMLHRIMLNNPIAKDIYHQHLSYFTQIFQNNQIDLILCSEYNLSTPNHLIPFGLGKLLGIPTYAIERIPSYPAISINNYNNSERLIFSTQNKCLTQDMLVFYKHRSLQQTKKTIRDKIEHFFGSVFIEFIKCIVKRSFRRKYLGIEYSFFDKMSSLFALKKMKKKYQKIAVLPNFEEKYIYYSIHLEPEATVIGKTILESQLTMIKMLSSALPNGWKLYVKEHPHQFMLNTSLTHYFLHNITFFKNYLFYQEIKKLPNVKLISLDVSTRDLIKNSQAISTINGTVTLEAMLENKCAILFSGKASLYGILDNVLHVASFQDLEQAIETITLSKHCFSPNKGFEKLKKYIAGTQDSNFYQNLFTTIEEHAKTIQPTGESL